MFGAVSIAEICNAMVLANRRTCQKSRAAKCIAVADFEEIGVLE